MIKKLKIVLKKNRLFVIYILNFSKTINCGKIRIPTVGYTEHKIYGGGMLGFGDLAL